MKLILTVLLLTLTLTLLPQDTCCVFVDQVKPLQATYCYVLNVFDHTGALIQSIEIESLEPIYLGKAQIIGCQ